MGLYAYVRGYESSRMLVTAGQETSGYWPRHTVAIAANALVKYVYRERGWGGGGVVDVREIKL